MSRYQYQPLASWDEFERLCCDLFKSNWNSRVISLHGRNGSRQNGVDIYGYPNGAQEIWGVQCKGKEIYPEKKIAIEQIEEEIDKALDFEPELDHYIFATTMRRDVKLQGELRKLVRRRELAFGVEIIFWDDIEDALNEDSHTADKYYPRNAEDTRKKSLFDRAKFNDRINIIEVFYGESDGDRVFSCKNYHLFGLVSKDRAWLELGGYHSQLPRHSSHIGHMRIDVKALSDLVEEFFFSDQVDIFDVNFNFREDWGSINMENEHVRMCGDFHVKDGKVYTDTEKELNEYDSDAYFGIRRYMSELVDAILKH
ncbi:hypothetical protein VCR14J2_270022 [Vibrio coralliirubri]|uniref:hypothetical protein n=1 Tax=Vibrio coralliirubri TaxID=1516159 RepID=UPI000632AC0F|nr:hypothetical protein [Vibrio coralliirubri]CDT99083.1 hypothetical protein VCR14J2_270022 [Vibrio coralliirubri]